MRFKTAPGYVVRQFMDEYLLIPVGSPGESTAQLAILNPAGAFLWEQLQQEKTQEELTAAMCAEFEVDEDTAAADIREFLELLENHHCLVKIDM